MVRLPLHSNGMYATVPQTKSELVTTDSTIDGDVFAIIEQASARIEAELSTSLEPFSAIRYFDAVQSDLIPRGNLMLLDENLLELTSLTLGDGTVLTASDYRLEPRNAELPYNSIRLINHSFYSWQDSAYQSIALDGIWGWRKKYASAWWELSTLSGNINDTVTSVGVVSGTDFQAGMLIRVGSEYMRVSSVSGHTLTVERGKNGTTAASHTLGDGVDYFQWDYALNRACVRLSAYMYHRRGAFENTTFDLGTGATVQYPADIPLEVKQLLLQAMPPRIWRTV